MQGLILVFNEQKQVGAIATPNGQRYLFPIKDWQEELSLPERGLKVEFDPGENNRAYNVRLALPDIAPSHSAQPTSPIHAPVEVVQIAQQPHVFKPKKKSVLTLLGLFLGAYGAHKFYLGAWGWGILYVLGGTFLTVLTIIEPLFSIFAFAFMAFITVEWIRYILMTDAQFESKLASYQARRPGPFSFFW
ncbi:NINE protein [Allofranklinella schreckenbergeri]|uniref:NINE protein n=1 Tax=Allofranklinella schreckenbergeri TaxID=1076744 RepID=A0A3M6PWH5_9BURK|nr:TM2 domain-containing protein [Allofranklinella schreckenbergeri]RMW95429.1 NINE protein [Allofranklinella schreckenbergeri]